jgi:hypothetical protein
MNQTDVVMTQLQGTLCLLYTRREESQGEPARKADFRTKAHKQSAVQDIEQWIVFTPLSVNVFVTLAAQ